MPVMHIHANNEGAIIQALLEMEAGHRVFGHEKMVSGSISLKNIQNPEAVLGQKLPIPTSVTAIDTGQDGCEPYFDMVLPIKADSSKIHFPERPKVIKADNDDLPALAAA